nr:MAG TPA: UvrABC system protein C [Caudoviricetes sp.]
MTKMSHWRPKRGIYIFHLYDIICYIGIFGN